jgi:hypothetical protein
MKTMKKKSSKKKKTITIIIAFFVSIFILYKSANIYFSYNRALYREIQFNILDWYDAKEKKKFDKVYEKTLDRYRSIVSTEGLPLLKNYEYKYFVGLGKDNEKNINYLCELKFEGDTPVVYEIDFFYNEKTIIRKTVLDKFSDQLKIYDAYVYKYYDFLDRELGRVKTKGFKSYYHYSFNDGNHYRITMNDNIPVIMSDNVAFYAHKSNDINEILAELSNHRKETQIKYTGVYEYERTEVQYDEYMKDEIIDGASRDQLKEISIIITGIGNLYGKFTGDTPDKNFERYFYIDADEVISRSTGESYQYRRYFDDNYIIEFASFSEKMGNPGHGEYKIYYKKANGT